MSSTLICYPVNNSSFLPLLFPLDGEKPDSYYLPFIYLILQFQHTSTSVSELLTHKAMGNYFIQ